MTETHVIAAMAVLVYVLCLFFIIILNSNINMDMTDPSIGNTANLYLEQQILIRLIYDLCVGPC